MSFGIVNLQGTEGVNAPPCIVCQHYAMHRTAADFLAGAVLAKLI